MCRSSDTFKRLRFPLASISMPSNTRDCRVSNVLTPKQKPANKNGYVRTSFILQQQLVKQSSVIGAIKNIAFASTQNLRKRLKTAQLKVKMVEDLGVQRYYVKEAPGVWHQYSCQMQGMGKRKLLCYMS